MTDTQPRAKAAHLLRATDWQFEYHQKCTPQTSNLDWLTYGMYRVAGGRCSDELYHRREEAILFCLDGEQRVEVDDRTFRLRHYDTLYVPLATPYRMTNEKDEVGILAVCRAPASIQHPPSHAEWERIRADETRIRHLDGKDVFLMFDVSEPGDRLLAGYTIYQPHTRAWPPHNHTDQEEIYLFTKGRGSMEVYADEKSKTFVHSMQALDAATIPLLNYHPVFSQEEELHFIWCLAGNRYWIGDKHREFMDGSVDELTTGTSSPSDKA
jgi:mannose-6-phosphate isomerase-like protein (cupin superfamily)